MGMISAGNLNRVVYLLRRGPDEDDGYGAEPGQWQRLGKRMASVKPVRRGEVLEAAGVAARRELTVWTWYDSVAVTMTAQDAVSIDGVVHQLTGHPVELGFHEGLELTVLAADPVERVNPLQLVAA